MHHLREAITLFPLVLVLTVLLASGVAWWLLRHHTIQQLLPDNYFHQFLAQCVCGELIHGCAHVQGVPSTWEHMDGTHFHDDKTMVEHA